MNGKQRMDSAGDFLDKPKIIYPELSYSIIGAAMEVHRELGAGWDEWDYHRSMIEALVQRGHRVESHLRKDVIFHETVADQFELDLLIDNLVLLELKHVRSAFHPSNFEQILNYLKRWEKRLGILINFGLASLAYKRVPYDVGSAGLSGSGKWEELSCMKPELCLSVMNAVRDVLDTIGYGYGVNTFRSLLSIALKHSGLVVDQLTLEPAFKLLNLGSRAVDCIVVSSELLISVSATGQNSSACDLTYLQSYMKKASVKYGVLVDVGKPAVQLKGVL